MADDIAQDALAVGLGGAAPDDPSVPPRQWLAGIARRLALAAIRRQRERQLHELIATQVRAVEPEDRARERLRVQDVLVHAVRELPEPYRTSIVMKYFEGAGAKTIARARNSTHAAVRQQVRRGLSMLRAKLDAEFGNRRAWLLLFARLDLPRPTPWRLMPMLTAVIALLLLYAVLVTSCSHRNRASEQPPLEPAPPPPPTEPPARFVYSLAQVMDQYHKSCFVYQDVSSPGSSFVAYAKIPGTASLVAMNGSNPVNPHSGSTCMQCQLPQSTDGGFYCQNGVLPSGASAPLPNFGNVPNSGVDLRGAEWVTFWARGHNGGEVVEFFIGGVGRDPASGAALSPYPDSTRRIPALGTKTTLTSEWSRYFIDVRGHDLSYVLGGFAWYATAADNPSGATFYLDDIQYQLSDAARQQRLDTPHFLRSYEVRSTNPDPFDANLDDDIDLTLRNVAFAYDNALAILAFLADGTSDSVRRARIIGDAFVYAADHDRFFTDGRVRTAYSAGDLVVPPGWTPNNRVGTAKIPGYYWEPTQTFHEVEQGRSDVGNNAWVMIALLALHRSTGQSHYLVAARRIGAFVMTCKNTTGTYQGFLGGFANPEGNPKLVQWASAEHNLDVFAAFTRLATLDGDPWPAEAQHAATFLEQMWDSSRGCYLAGTTNPSTRNSMPGQLPLDVQAWSVLALPNTLLAHPSVLESAQVNHWTTDAGLQGVDFNEDRDGIWFEGTAQLCIARAFAADPNTTFLLRTQLETAQATPQLGNGLGLAATTHDGLTTGFGFRYYQRIHIAATAWAAMALRGFNPFYQTHAQF